MCHFPVFYTFSSLSLLCELYNAQITVKKKINTRETDVKPLVVELEPWYAEILRLRSLSMWQQTLSYRFIENYNYFRIGTCMFAVGQAGRQAQRQTDRYTFHKDSQLVVLSYLHYFTTACQA